jgi:hypothetical protein
VPRHFRLESPRALSHRTVVREWRTTSAECEQGVGLDGSSRRAFHWVEGWISSRMDAQPVCRAISVADVDDHRTAVEQEGVASRFRNAFDGKGGQLHGSVSLN